jgi:hypothetical protein
VIEAPVVLPSVNVFTAAPVAILTVVADASAEKLIAFTPVATVKVPPPKEAFPPVAVVLVPTVREVVEVIDPGAMNVEGTENVNVFSPPVVVIWFAVPAIVREPRPSGTTGLVPASGTKESIAIPPPVKSIVRVPAVPVTVTPVPPTISMFPATGEIAPPESPVRVMTAPAPPEPRAIQLPDPGHI